MKKERIFTFNILRVILVVWIAFYWHLANYILPDFVPSQQFAARLTNGVLATFMFLSGLFTSSGKFMNWSMAKLFFVNRFKRFYVLYVLAAISLFFVHYPFVDGFFPHGIKQLLMSLLGFATLLNYAPSTLWFMDLLLFFIWITPLIFSCKYKHVIGLVTCILFYIAQRFYMVDGRLVSYLPFYLMGLFLSPSSSNLNMKYSIFYTILFLLVLFIPFEGFVYSFMRNTCIILGLIGLSHIIERFIIQDSMVGKRMIVSLSYSSMALYFFHRQIYALCHALTIPIILWPLIVFLLSYAIQAFYDFLGKMIVGTSEKI